jgi:hypothetical protein
MLLDVVAALGGGVVATLAYGATTLVVGASAVGGSVHCPAMIAVSFRMAHMCLILSADNFGTVPPKYLEEVCCCCNGEVMLQGNWDLSVSWVQMPGVGEAEAARCRDVESKASIVVGGGSNVETIGCMWCPGSL